MQKKKKNNNPAQFLCVHVSLAALDRVHNKTYAQKLLVAALPGARDYSLKIW